MLKRQLLGEMASKGALPVEELAAAWQGAGTPRGRTGPVAPLAPRQARRPVRQPVRQPHDRVAWMLLLESAWWEELSAADHALLCALPGWHGEAFRFIDQQTAERGSQSWAVLRERLASQAWGESALALIEGEDPAIEPLIDDLRSSMAQIRMADAKTAAARVLGRL
jgi:DNA primase